MEIEELKGLQLCTEERNALTCERVTKVNNNRRGSECMQDKNVRMIFDQDEIRNI